MEHWCGSGSRAAAIVRWSALRHGEVPFGVREGTPPMDAAEAAWSVHGWFDERNVTAARSLYLELEHNLDDVTHHDILRRVERALRSGELVAYRMRPWSEAATDGGTATHPPARAKPSAPKPSAPAPIEATVPTHFSVRWVDELNLPLSGVAVVFFISGRRHKATTGGDGVARYTDPEGSGFAWAHRRRRGERGQYVFVACDGAIIKYAKQPVDGWSSTSVLIDDK